MDPERWNGVDQLTELRSLLAAQDRDSLIGKRTCLRHQRGAAQKHGAAKTCACFGKRTVAKTHLKG